MTRPFATSGSRALLVGSLVFAGLAGGRLAVLRSRARRAPERTATLALAPGPTAHVDDGVGLIAWGDRVRFEEYLASVEHETGIAIALVFRGLPAGASLERYAAAEATRRNLGAKTGQRGLLVIYDTTAKRLRIEVGYGLEGYFSDAFIGRLITDHTRVFFRAGDVATGLRLMTFILHWRIRDQMLGGRFDPTPFERRAAGMASGGAGASGSAPLGAEGRAIFLRTDTAGRAARRARFGPQRTVRAAHARYIEWLADGVYDPELDLFTPDSRRYLAHFPMTQPYFDHILAGIWGEPIAVVERGDLAIAYYTATPLISPMFFRRDAAGWRVDTVAEVQGSYEIVGSWLTWCVQPAGVAAAFQDLYVAFGGCRRVRAGDNTPLPTPRRAAA